MDLQSGMVREALLCSNAEGRYAVQLLSDSLVLVHVPNSKNMLTINNVTQLKEDQELVSCCSCMSYLFSKLVVG